MRKDCLLEEGKKKGDEQVSTGLPSGGCGGLRGRQESQLHWDPESTEQQ